MSSRSIKHPHAATHQHRPLLPAPNSSPCRLFLLSSAVEHARLSSAQDMDPRHLYDHVREAERGIVGRVLGAPDCESGRGNDCEVREG